MNRKRNVYSAAVHQFIYNYSPLCVHVVFSDSPKNELCFERTCWNCRVKRSFLHFCDVHAREVTMNMHYAKSGSPWPEHSSNWVPGSLLSSEVPTFPHSIWGQTTHLFWHTALSLLQAFEILLFFFKKKETKKSTCINIYILGIITVLHWVQRRHSQAIFSIHKVNLFQK